MKKILLLTLIIVSISIISSSKLHAYDITVGATTWYAWMNQYADDFPTDKMGAALLYGPAVSVKYDEEFNLTFVFLYGRYDAFDRKDSDLALNYRWSEFIKVFAGLKYMGYTDAFIQHNALGPGFGASITYPLTEDIFLLGTLSGLFLFGNERFDYIVKEKESFIEYGLNMTMSFAYYIADFSTAISLGGRCQFYRTSYFEDTLDYNTLCYGVTLTATYTF